MQAQTGLRQGDDRRQKQDNPTRGDLGRETISVRSERMSRTCHRSQCKRCPPRARRYQLDGPRAASRHRTLKVASIPGAATSSWNSFFCPKPLFGQNSTMATSLAAGRAPRPRARPPRRPRHQAPPRGRAGTRAAPWRHLPGQNNKDQNSDQNSQNRIRTKIATRKRTRWRKTTRGGHRGGGVPAGWPNRHGAKNSARARSTNVLPSHPPPVA